MQNSFFPAFDSICCSRFFLILAALAVFCVISFVPAARAQENYEIQVYAYDTVEPGHDHGGTTQKLASTFLLPSTTDKASTGLAITFVHAFAFRRNGNVQSD
jgi:hypothetical protein